MRLDQFDNSEFQRGASVIREAIWLLFQGTFFASWLPGSGWRCAALRVFGAKVGKGVVIKPHARVKFPWRLRIGEHAWVGESVWIDNLDQVTIGAHTCISQGAYLCTGSHDWTDVNFALRTKPISIGEGVWIGAQSSVAPGSVLLDGTILTLGSAAIGTLAADTVFTGNPAGPVGKRVYKNSMKTIAEDNT